MSKPKYLITNLVYGDTYARLFLNNHLKSLLDPTNLPAIVEKYDVELMIMSDHQTIKTITMHPNAKKLSDLLLANGGKVSSHLFGWPPEVVNRFAFRYTLLLKLFKESVRMALEQNALLTTWVADLVVAKEFFPRILSRIEQGHGAVFVLPLRAASEPLTLPLQAKPGAFEDIELCQMGIDHLHPLWVASHWDTPQFTKLPFTLLWNTGAGLLVRSFSTTPIIFRPTPAMLESRGMIDGDIPGLCENPYWASDWTDAPVIGVEPLACYYPPFHNRKSSLEWVAEWAKALDKTQVPFLLKHLYYPNRQTVAPPVDMLAASDRVASNIVAGAK